ncbi:MFS transporter [Paratractidigestivibacter sp.]|uniref:MFS transporter n=1 Tax=Paratractidigestivibacter sp. TaxID=2847316 RepID=UPI002ABD6BF0|nr:MFS transporter [Paratractidigestivibacter sp.]
MSSNETTATNSNVSAGEKSAKTTTSSQKIRFGASYFLFSLLWMVGLCIVSVVLLPQRLTDIDPATKVAATGVLNAVTAFVSLASNLVVGNLSDRTRSIFGRRSPWIVGGGVLAGVSMFLMGVVPNVVLIGVMYSLAMVGLNAMIAPIMAALADRVPDDMRGTVSGFIAAGNLMGNSLGTLIGAYFITVMVPGFVLSGVLMGISGLVAVLVWPKEASSKDMPKLEGGLSELLVSFRPPKNAPDFYLAFAGRTLILFAYQMISVYQLYILQDYMGQSAEESAATISVMSIVLMVASLISSLSAGRISDMIGRRKPPVVIASVLLAIGTALPWFIHTPFSMVLYVAVGGFGYGVYSAVDQALNVDVLPDPEAAGKDLGILNMATTLGQMVGPIAASLLVSVTGGYGSVFATSVVAALLACVFILKIKSVE